MTATSVCPYSPRLPLLPIPSLPPCSPSWDSVQPIVKRDTQPDSVSPQHCPAHLSNTRRCRVGSGGRSVGFIEEGLHAGVGGSSRSIEARATPHTHHDRAKRSPTGQSPPSRSPGEKCQLGSALHPDRNSSPQGAGYHRDPPLSPYLTLDCEPPHLAARPRCPSRSPLTGQAENWGAGGTCMQDTWAGEDSAVCEEGSLWSCSTGHPPCIRAGHGAE